MRTCDIDLIRYLELLGHLSRVRDSKTLLLLIVTGKSFCTSKMAGKFLFKGANVYGDTVDITTASKFRSCHFNRADSIHYSRNSTRKFTKKTTSFNSKTWGARNANLFKLF